MTARLGMGVEFSFLVGGFFGLVVDVVIFFLPRFFPDLFDLGAL